MFKKELKKTKQIFFGNIDVSNRVIAYSDLSFAFPSNMPILPGHTLVCPFRCVENMHELTDRELHDLFSLIVMIKNALRKEFNAAGFNTAWNENIVAGQSVPHLHVHIVPRSKNDKGIVDYEPREFLYRPGIRESSPEEELVNIAASLKRHI